MTNSDWSVFSCVRRLKMKKITFIVDAEVKIIRIIKIAKKKLMKRIFRKS